MAELHIEKEETDEAVRMERGCNLNRLCGTLQSAVVEIWVLVSLSWETGTLSELLAVGKLTEGDHFVPLKRHESLS